MAVFEGNKVTNNASNTNGGGAINMSNGNLKITGYRFDNNSSAKLGGAIRTTNGNREITGAIFKNNYTTGNGGTGGAIHVEGANVDIKSTHFENNYTKKGDAYGGALYIKLETGINENVGRVNTFVNNYINDNKDNINHIFVNVTSSQLIESPETSIGTGKEDDENITFGE